jgi:hypothetical protein
VVIVAALMPVPLFPNNVEGQTIIPSSFRSGQ